MFLQGSVADKQPMGCTFSWQGHKMAEGNDQISIQIQIQIQFIELVARRLKIKKH